MYFIDETQHMPAISHAPQNRKTDPSLDDDDDDPLSSSFIYFFLKKIENTFDMFDRWHKMRLWGTKQVIAL